MFLFGVDQPRLDNCLSVTEYFSGADLLEAINQREDWDIAIVAIMMPIVDGWTIVHRAKTDRPIYLVVPQATSHVLPPVPPNVVVCSPETGMPTPCGD